jgi:adsorption protein A
MGRRQVLSFPIVAGLFLSLVIFPRPLLSAEDFPGAPPQDKSAYLTKLPSRRQQNWLQAEIRQFRGFPHLDRAYRLMEAGRWDKAREELQQYLAIDPADLKGRYSYMLVLFKLGDYATTITQADRILSQSPTFVPGYLYRGLARQALGRLDEAQADFQQAGALPDVQAKDRLFAWRMVVDLAIRRGQYQAAQATLERLLAQGKDFGLWFRLGLVQEKQGRLTEAQQAYRQALEAADQPGERLKALLALGELAKKRQDWQAARRALLAALELAPQDPGILRSLAENAYARRNYADSAQWLRQLRGLGASPKDQEFLVNVLEAQKEYGAMQEELLRLLAQAKEPAERQRLYLALGQAYLKSGDYGRAVPAFQAAVKLKAEVPSLEALAHALEQAGRSAEAGRQYRELLKLSPEPRYHLELGRLLEKRGEPQAALSQMKLAQGNLAPALKGPAYREIGQIYYGLGDFAAALEYFKQALAFRPRDPALYQSLAETANRLNLTRQALAYQQQAVEIWGEGRAPGQVFETLGNLYLKQGEARRAAESFRQALAAGRDDWRLRQNLGLAFFQLKEWPQAAEQFRLSFKNHPTPQSLTYLGLIYQEQDQPGLAIAFLEQALSQESQLEKSAKKDLYNTLGYLYAREHQYSRAAEMWGKSLRLKDDAVIALHLAEMQQRLGRQGEAGETLAQVNPDRLPAPLRAEYFEAQAPIRQKAGHPEKALESLQQAIALAPTADRYYRQGLIYRELGQLHEALHCFAEAKALDPENNQYATALGYTQLSLKHYPQAAHLFENVLQRDPDYLELYKDLGYIYLKGCRNDRAVAWFKRAIDNRPLYLARTPAEKEELEREMYRLRKEITKANTFLDFTSYLSYQSVRRGESVAPGAPGVLGGGAVPSQGGVEFAYQPPELGFRDERIFQIFGRVLWNVKPTSLRFDEDSFQGGIGLRYKPLKTQNLWLQGERLVRMGDNGLNTWLLRLLYSWDHGYDLQPGEKCWDYTYFYGDGAYFTQMPGTWAYYIEARQGITFNYRDRLLVSPHVEADVRYQDPLTTNSSYLEGGIGLSLRYLFYQPKYEVHRASFEVLSYYKWGDFLKRGFSPKGSPYNGLFITGIFRVSFGK